MLAQLFVKNYVLIEKASIDFDDGFHVFTGETGAGKSLLLDALSFVSGMRSQAKVVGPYDDEAFVEAVFYLDDGHPAHKLMEQMHYDREDVLVVQRSMNEKGRSVAKVNGRHITLSKLSELMDTIIDIHRQDETQEALKQKNHLRLLDRFAKVNYSRYQKAFKKYVEAKRVLNDFMDNQHDTETLEFYRFQMDTFEKLNPSEEEYQNLVEEIEYLENFEKYHRTFELVDQNLSEALSSLYDANEKSQDLFDEEIQKRIESIYVDLDDFYHDFANSRRSDHFDEQRFNSLNERLFEYQKLIRKHGSIEDVLTYQQHISQILDEAENHDFYLENLKKDVVEARKEAESEAEKLRKVRLKKAKELSLLVEKELKSLLLENAKFEVVLEESELNSFGYDKIAFKVAMNPGMPFEDIEKTVSGGEKSRLMLGLKVAFSKVYDVETFIFDEIDTGLSGQAGFAIGEKMKRLGEEKQVMSITHLASVAACADTHYRIYKEGAKTDVVSLSEKQRLDEMALMISGEAKPSSLKAAKEMYERGQSL